MASGLHARNRWLVRKDLITPDTVAHLWLREAVADDLAFARELTRGNMRPYYAQYGLIWQPDAFDAEWALRRSFIIGRSSRAIGYTLETSYLYVRDVQVAEPFRGEGVGSWVMQQLVEMAHRGNCTRVRLKVFRSNPAISLYLRQGYSVVGEEAALYWMELTL